VRRVTPFLWFDDQALPAAKLYVSLFPRSKITAVTRRGRKVFTVAFELAGVSYLALDGGPHYKLNPAFSLYVSCKDQREIDALWKRLARGGKPLRCGWLEDRFGLTWQIIPDELPGLIEDPRGMEAMMGMQKIDLAALRAAVAR
jgi:predicted 3-demethylubiquinone-9 3-methyltransferase (glyoxalase superfamily)